MCIYVLAREYLSCLLAAQAELMDFRRVVYRAPFLYQRIQQIILRGFGIPVARAGQRQAASSSIFFQSPRHHSTIIWPIEMETETGKPLPKRLRFTQTSPGVAAQSASSRFEVLVLGTGCRGAPRAVLVQTSFSKYSHSSPAPDFRGSIFSF